MKVSFKPITLNDRGIITSFTFPSDHRNCDFSFANMCSWRFLYGSEFAVHDGMLLIRFWIEDKSRLAYMMPIGNGDLAQTINLLEEDSMQHGHPLCMLGITPEAKDKLEDVFPKDFYYIPERDYYDYIYNREDLVLLKGKKYQSKRNHINNFKKQYSYEYIPITPDIIPQCLELECRWYKANHTQEEGNELNDERRSVSYALNHFNELGLIGGALWVEGEIIAFSFGAPINQHTFAVHIEKADITYDGAYTLMNQEFASRLPEEYRYVNREEDLGIPGLRQAKLSYHPAILLEKSAAIKKPVQNK